MPDRLIREGLVNSPKVNALSDRAECAFVRLLLKVDDFGVYFAEPKMVRAAIWPMKSVRDAEVARVLDEIERVGLLARFTAPDGLRYLCLLRFGQRLAYGKRRRHPAPPFDEETGEMRLELVGEPPSVSRPGAVAEKKRSEEKGGKARAARKTAPSPVSDETAPESHEAWLTRIQTAWPHVDVQSELAKAVVEKGKRGGQLERDWFERSWLPKCSIVVTRADVFAAKASVSGEVIPAEGPEDWKLALDGTALGDQVWADGLQWSDLNEGQKKFVIERLGKRKASA